MLLLVLSMLLHGANYSIVQLRQQSTTLLPKSIWYAPKKKNISVNAYKRPAKANYPFSVLFFYDARSAHNRKHDQLGFMVGVLIGNVLERFLFYLVHLVSSKSKRRIRSICSAKITAAGKMIDDVKLSKMTPIKILSPDND